MIVAPGAYDGLTGKLIASARFSAACMTGAGTAAGLGYPDFGLLTMTAMAENAGRIVQASGLPVIADADTGFGNELNVTVKSRNMSAAASPAWCFWRRRKPSMKSPRCRSWCRALAC